MGKRYSKNFYFKLDYEKLFNAVNNYLTSQGYDYTVYKGESVWQKGNGWVAAPTFLKLTNEGEVIRLEAWIKQALLPGVFVGEMGIDGFYGFAIKEQLKSRVNVIESIIQQQGFDAAQKSQQAETLESSEEKNSASAVSINNTQSFTPPVNSPYVLGMTKKEFRKNSPSFKKRLRGLAIFCYVLVGINLLSVFLNPLVLIDTIALLGVTLGMHLGRSKGCAIGLLVLGIIEMLATIIAGYFGAYLWVAAGIGAVMIFNYVDKEYKAYADGAVTLPVDNSNFQ